MARQRRVVAGVVLLGVGCIFVVGFVNRRGLLERYWSSRLESEDEEERWEAAARLRAMGSARAEEWYIARLTEEPRWEKREQAARALGEMRSVRAVRALLELDGRVAARDGTKTGASPRTLLRGYGVHDLAPKGRSDGDNQEILIDLLQQWSGDDLFRGEMSGFLYARVTDEGHDTISTLLRSLQLTRQVLSQIGPAALDELARIRDDDRADGALRLHARLEWQVLQLSEEPL